MIALTACGDHASGTCVEKDTCAVHHLKKPCSRTGDTFYEESNEKGIQRCTTSGYELPALPASKASFDKLKSGAMSEGETVIFMLRAQPPKPAP